VEEDFVNLEEAITTAIEFETQVSKLYRDAMEKSTDPMGKLTFGVLADEELKHLNYLEGRLDELRRTGAITAGELDTALPSEQMVKEGIGRLETRMTPKDKGSELQMLGKALEVEQDTTDFYRRMASELSDEGQKIFARFVEIEEGHLAIVRAEIDYLSRTGYWFDIKEFDME
jgi:rubrerythrin